MAAVLIAAGALVRFFIYRFFIRADRFFDRAHQGEEDDVANRRAIGEQHGQAVDADALTTGRRHAVLEGGHVVGIVGVSLIVTLFFGIQLLTEPLGLYVGVVELGKGVGDFHAAEVKLEALGKARVVGLLLGKG